MTHHLDTGVLCGDGPVWKINLDTEKGLDLASPEGLGPCVVLGEMDDQLHVGAGLDTHTDTWTQSGTWRWEMKHPYNHLVGSTILPHPPI